VRFASAGFVFASLLGVSACSLFISLDDLRFDASAPIDASSEDANIPPDSPVADAPLIDAGVDAPLAIVQSIGLAVFGPANVTIQTPSPQTKGNLNVVAVSWQSGGKVTGISDTDGNTYLVAVPSTSSIDLGHAIYYAKNINGGLAPNVITVLTQQTTSDAGANDPNVDVLEISGLDTASPFETMNQSNGQSASMTSNNVITTVPRSMLVASGVLDYGFSFADASTSFTVVPLTGARVGDVIGYQIAQTPGTYAATVTLPVASYWMLQLAAFK
jgi:hypothetical protein